MKRIHLIRGLEFDWRGRRFVIERRDENRDVQFRDTLNNEYQTLPEANLVDEIFNGALEVIHRHMETGKENKFAVDLDLVPESKRNTAERRHAYVQKCISRKIEKATVDVLAPIIAEVAAALNDPNPPNWYSVYRWLREYTNAGFDIQALVPKNRPGNRRRRFGKNPKAKLAAAAAELAQETATVVQDVISEHYMNRQRLSVEAVYDLLEIRIAETNHFRDEGNKLPMPGRTSIHHIVSNIDEYEKDRARLGKRIADQRHTQRGIGIRPTRPLEEAETDHTKLDEMVVDDENMLPLGRPWITVLIDKYSGLPLGRYVSFEPPGSNSIMQCLLHAIRPKTYLREKFPSIQNDWPAYGIPETIRSDNGMEFLGKHYRDACLQLGIHINYSPVRQPWFKASIERFFGTQNKQLLHRLPGTTFSNIFEKGEDYNPQKNAVISFSAFVEILDTWIVDIYSREIHRGYEHTGPSNIPIETWLEGIEKYPPALPPSGMDLDVLLRRIEYRTIDQGGVELFSLRYNDPMLSLVRREAKGKKVLIKYDSSDLSMIYVADERQGIYIPVPALDQAYTKGLSLYQHEIIKKFVRNQLKSRVNNETLVAAKARIQEIVNQEIHLTKKTSMRVRAARYLQIDSRKASRAVSPVSPEDHRNFIPEPVPMLPPASADAKSEENNIEAPFENDSTGIVTKRRRTKKRPEDFEASESFAAGFDETEQNPLEAGADENPDLSGWGADFNLPK